MNPNQHPNELELRNELEKLKAQNALLRETNGILEEQYIQSRLNDRKSIQFRNALNAASLLVITNREGVIEEVNSLFCGKIERKPEEVIGRHYSVFIESANSLFSTTVIDLFKARQSWLGELLVGSVARKQIALKAAIHPITDELSQVTGFLTIGQDIPERKNSNT